MHVTMATGFALQFDDISRLLDIAARVSRAYSPAMRADPPQQLSHSALFMGFFQAGIFGFGGVLPMARRMIVDDRRWLTQVEFNELFAVCQSLPGANITNFAAVFGMRHRGVSGAAAALAGLLGAPMAIVMALAGLYARYGALAPVHHALGGLAAAAAGLLLGTAGKIATPVCKTWSNAAVALLVLAMALGLHLSLPLTMLLALPLSLFLCSRTTP
jgi:chromate transporter